MLKYWKKINTSIQKYKIYGVIFDIDNKKTSIKQLQEITNKSDFWNDTQNAKKILKNIKKLEIWVQSWNKLKTEIDDIEVFIELQKEEPEENLEPEISQKLNILESEIEELEFKRMLGGEYDERNAILTIHPGAGGTESQDWAEMLLRMYLRYAEISGFKTEILDQLSGDEAGIKSVTIEFTGDFAYGYLRAEAGVHRLVRLSPFDANNKRHTSFASVFVLPEIEESIDIEIDPTDLRIDTFRASGAGGQHVNKTDSAIRITHIPTGTVVQCQNERSQHKNKANAMKILGARLFKLQEEEQKKNLEKFEKNKKDIAWGSQIRSYVFHPYNMVKDHRTGYETSNVQAVMDGQIEKFIKEYLVKN
ncbi:MAG: peptide chain release factor 2 [Calditrichia bacterium]|nr:peptide chain release factor 2 [Calditrichia bacterium]